MNLAVVPFRPGVNPNHVVLAWDYQWRDPFLMPSIPVPWTQRYTIGNPELPTSFMNRVLTVELGPNNLFYGDLFCAGQCWLPDGRLFVAGGNARYGGNNPANPFDAIAGGAGSVGFLGSRFVGIWDAVDENATGNGWIQLGRDAPTFRNPMRIPRWYPTCTLVSDRYVVVAGGQVDTALPVAADQAYNTYEVFDINAIGGADWVRDQSLPGNPPRLYLRNGAWSVTPTSPQQSIQELGLYPRDLFLSNNRTFALSWSRAASMRYDALLPPGTDPIWVGTGTTAHAMSSSRNEAPLVFVPNVGNLPGGRDRLMVVGGTDNALPVPSVVSSSEQILASSPGAQWGAAQAMQLPRMQANVVLVPNGDVLAIGGCATHYWGPLKTPQRRTEVWSLATGWQLDDAQASSRMYHSTAALLPSGRVVSAGGDMRYSVTGSPWQAPFLDWEVFTPRNIANGQRVPAFASSANPVAYTFGQNVTIDFVVPPSGDDSVGADVARVVLMRPGSCTHTVDTDQRYIELAVNGTPDATQLSVTMPPPPQYSSTAPGGVPALPGYYMMFLVTSQGATSTAKWVRLQ